MINLIPPEYQKEIKEEENRRVISILGIVSLFVLISLALILFSIEIYISGQVQSQKIIFEQAEESLKTSEITAFEKKIQRTNQDLSNLSTFYQEQKNITQMLEEISRTFPSGVYLTRLSLQKVPFPEKEKGKKKGIEEEEYDGYKITIRGFCPTREVLLEFRKNLVKKENFKEVDFPLSNWVKISDVDFLANFRVSI
jgi:Tfp pilus assembly protein PilN